MFKFITVIQCATVKAFTLLNTMLEGGCYPWFTSDLFSLDCSSDFWDAQVEFTLDDVVKLAHRYIGISS